jgi:hypothetical protein
MSNWLRRVLTMVAVLVVALMGAPALGAVAQPTPQLPLGGRHIYLHYRVVAFYGAPGGPGLGVLGKGTAEQAARAVLAQAKAYRGYGRAVQPAMELIASVAQANPGADGKYSTLEPDAAIDPYLAAAHRHKMLLILDFQPGRGSFLPQVQHYAKYLADPWVGVGLDPEWKVGPTQVPGAVIGSASAASINQVSDYLARLTTRLNLPQKLFVVHEFTSRMLPDRSNIRRHPGLALTFQADGHGNQAVKKSVYAGLNFPTASAAGFKLFYTQDTGLMTPKQVMALPRRPDLVTYE